MKYLPLVVVAALLASCSKPDLTLSERLDSLFTAETDKGLGAAVLVSIDDSTAFSKSYGVADIKTGERVTEKTLFNIGSISKTFVANAILILRDQKKLSLEDSLIKYFPEFKNKDIARKVKIKHLLTHTSGLPDNRPVQEQREFYLTADDAQNWQPITQADSLEFEPGTRYEYSNPAFNGLAVIIEKVTGQKWQSFVDEKIFEPASMNLSTITDGSHPESGVSHGYVEAPLSVLKKGKDGKAWMELDYGEEPTFCAAGNGGVWSSVEELAKYHSAIENAKFSYVQTIAESKEIKQFGDWKGDKSPCVGWSWFIGRTTDGVDAPGQIGHTGTQGGFYSDYVTIPERKTFYVMLANFPIERDKVRGEVLRILEEEGL